jgi:hypothetical protein
MLRGPTNFNAIAGARRDTTECQDIRQLFVHIGKIYQLHSAESVILQLRFCERSREKLIDENASAEIHQPLFFLERPLMRRSSVTPPDT